MRSYGQYCPIAKATEILGDRWTLLIVRELLADVHQFNELERGLPGISRSLLSKRLRRLERAGIIERCPAGRGRPIKYHLTSAGLELGCVIDILGEWDERFAFSDPRPEELDPVLLMYWLKRRAQPDRLPQQRVVIQFDLSGPHPGHFWLLLIAPEVSVCVQPPGPEIDLLVTANIAALYRVCVGQAVLADALRDGTVQLDGSPDLMRSFGAWFALSPYIRLSWVRMASVPPAADSGVRRSQV